LSALISDLGDRSSYVIDEGRVLSFAAIHLFLRAISQGRRPAAITKWRKLRWRRRACTAV